MAVKKLLGCAHTAYGWPIGVVKSQQFSADPEVNSRTPLTKWRFFASGATETWGCDTRREAEDVLRKVNSVKPFSQWVNEDAPANAAGGGGVAGIGIGVKGEPGVDLRKKRKDLDPLAEDAQTSAELYKEIVDHLNADGAVKVQTMLKHYGPYFKKHVTMFKASSRPGDRGVYFQHGKNWLYASPETVFFYKRKLAEDVQPDDQFAGADVFNVTMDEVLKSRNGKNRYHRYSRYVGENSKGEQIRQHGRSTKRDIVLKDESTGVMVYLRRKKQKA